jgi:hypothetical protein
VFCWPARPNLEQSILDNLAKAGIQNGGRDERISLATMETYAGSHIQAVGEHAHPDQSAMSKRARSRRGAGGHRGGGDGVGLVVDDDQRAVVFAVDEVDDTSTPPSAWTVPTPGSPSRTE